MLARGEHVQDAEPRARIFISYSRKDLAFIDRLEPALKGRGFEVSIDREEIYAFEDWWLRIEGLIGKADTIVFVLSPDAVTSEVCAKEVAHAVSLNKRFAPIVCRQIDDNAVPPPLRRLNFVFFDDPEKFEPNLERLAEALRTDIGWIRKHTEYGEAAREWAAAGKPSGLLLRSPALEDAEHWIASRPSAGPEATEEIHSFIVGSRRAATQRRNMLSAALGAGLILALALAGLAFWQRGIAIRETQVAETQRSIAVDQRDKTLVTQSNFLIGLSNSRRLVGDAPRAVSLALEGLPGSSVDPDRPYVPGAELALRLAYRNAQALQFRQLSVHRLDEKIRTAVLSPDGRLFATASGPIVRLWDRASGAQKAALSPQDNDVWVLYFESADQLIAVSKTSLRVWDLQGPTLALEFSAQAGQQICGWQFSSNEELQRAVVVGTTSIDNSVGRPKLNMRSSVAPQHEFLASPQCSLLSAVPLAPLAIGTTVSMDFLSVGTSAQSVIVGKDLNLALMDLQSGFHTLPVGNEKYALARLSPDGSQVAAATVNKVVIWDVRNAVRLAELPTGKSILNMNFSGDGQLLFLALADDTVQVWARGSFGELRPVIVRKTIGNYKTRRVRQGCGDVDDKLLADHPNVGRQFSSDDHSGAPQHVFGSTSWHVRDIESSINGRRVMIVAQSAEHPKVNRVLTFDAESGKLLEDVQHEFGDATQCVRLSPDGQRIAVLDERLFRLFDIHSEKLKSEIRSSNGVRFLAEAFNATGTRVATYRSNGEVSLINSAFGDIVDDGVWPDLTTDGPASLSFDADGRHTLIDLGTHRYSWAINPSAVDLIEAAEDSSSSCIAPQERRIFSLSDEPPDWCVAKAKKPYDTAIWKKWLADKQGGGNPTLPYKMSTR